MSADDVWKDRSVAASFLNMRSLLIPDRNRQLEVLLRLLRAASRPPERVLDLGCGDAIVLATVLEAWPRATGVGLDFSPLMLEAARVRLSRFESRATVHEADLQNSTWQNVVTGPFDAVVSSLAIHHLTDDRKRALYQEIYSMLNPGGVFVNVEHVASVAPGGEEMFNDVMSELLYLRRQEQGENTTFAEVRLEFIQRPDRSANILALVEDQCRWLREIGFQHVDCFWKYFELSVFGGVR